MRCHTPPPTTACDHKFALEEFLGINRLTTQPRMSTETTMPTNPHFTGCATASKAGNPGVGSYHSAKMSGTRPTVTTENEVQNSARSGFPHNSVSCFRSGRRKYTTTVTEIASVHSSPMPNNVDAVICPPCQKFLYIQIQLRKFFYPAFTRKSLRIFPRIFNKPRSVSGESWLISSYAAVAVAKNSAISCSRSRV